METIVIGAGVVGASIAARLAQKGARVTLVDRAAPGMGTTSTSYAWVNSNGKDPLPYFAINLEGLKAHARLSPAGEAGWLGPDGHVEIAVDDTHRDDLAARVQRLRQRDYGVEEIDIARARTLLPDVEVPANAQLIVHFPEERYAYPLAYLAHMLAEAREAGVRILTDADVVAIDGTDDGAEVRLASGDVLSADTVVSAVGRWSADLAALAGIEVPVLSFATPGDLVVGYLVTTNPLPVRLTRLVTSPWLNVRPAGGGRLLLQALDLDGTADPRDVPGPDSPLAEAFLERLARLIPAAAGARVEQIVVGQRAMPADGRTIVGAAPGAPWYYVVATHSGVTLAPYLADAVTAELLGERQEAFEEFRLERFAAQASYGKPLRPRKPGQQ